MDLIDIFRIFHPNAEEYTFFSKAQRTFSRIDYILDHKSNLSTFKKIEIVSSIFSDHSAMKLDINYRKKKKKTTVKNTNTGRLNNMFLNNEQVTEEVKSEIKKFLETNDNENITTQNLWDEISAITGSVERPVSPFHSSAQARLSSRAASFKLGYVHTHPCRYMKTFQEVHRKGQF